MAKTMRNMTLAALSAVVLVGAPTGAAAGPSSRIVVHVLDYANVPPADLQKATAEASRIFAAAGVEVVWLAGENTDHDPDARLRLKVVLLDRTMGMHKIATDHVGSYVLGQASRSTGRAYIFTHRISEKGFTTGQGFARILGRVMGHEMGHLVLPVAGHSVRGIMQEEGDMRANSSPTFTPEQAALIVQEVAAPAIGN